MLAPGAWAMLTRLLVNAALSAITNSTMKVAVAPTKVVPTWHTISILFPRPMSNTGVLPSGVVCRAPFHMSIDLSDR